jgi:8-oxo-dGTP pyrophosphatase MutT (NUDIX family)
MSVMATDGLPDWLAPVVALVAQPDADVFADWPRPDGAEPTAASVLILLGHGDHADDGPDVLLLERAHDMRSHAGQIAFPGGRRDDTDRDDVETALREATEETGLEQSGVVVIGALRSIWLPPTNFQVTPVLAWWRAPSAVHAVDPAETAAVVRVAVSMLTDPANRVMMRHPSGHVGPAFLVHDLVVWGFTAGLLSRVLTAVGWDRPWDEARVVDLPEGLAASSMRDMRRAGYVP